MIMQQRGTDGKNAVVISGSVWTAPYSRKTKVKGIPVCSFFIRYGTTYSPEGKRLADTVPVECYGYCASVCSYLQRKTWVIVFGYIERDDFTSNRLQKNAFKVKAEMVIPVGFLMQASKPKLEEMANNTYPNPDQFTQFAEISGNEKEPEADGLEGTPLY